jgi:hypothetical protein
MAPPRQHAQSPALPALQQRPASLIRPGAGHPRAQGRHGDGVKQRKQRLCALRFAAFRPRHPRYRPSGPFPVVIRPDKLWQRLWGVIGSIWHPCAHDDSSGPVGRA